MKTMKKILATAVAVAAVAAMSVTAFASPLSGETPVRYAHHGTYYQTGNYTCSYGPNCDHTSHSAYSGHHGGYHHR